MNDFKFNVIVNDQLELEIKVYRNSNKQLVMVVNKLSNVNDLIICQPLESFVIEDMPRLNKKRIENVYEKAKIHISNKNGFYWTFIQKFLPNNDFIKII